MKKILIIEDDPAILMGLKTSLAEQHYQIITADDGLAGYELAKESNVDLIILDLMLPSKNGEDICRDLRHSGAQVFILMLSIKTEEMDKVLGLEIGADDYMTKPFSMNELSARIRALLRRSAVIKTSVDDCVIGETKIDFKGKTISKGETEHHLSAREFDVLHYFVLHADEVVTRRMLLEDIWGYDNFPTTRTVDNFVLSLRKIIEDDPSNPVHLVTCHTAGYKLIMEP